MTESETHPSLYRQSFDKLGLEVMPPTDAADGIPTNSLAGGSRPSHPFGYSDE